MLKISKISADRDLPFHAIFRAMSTFNICSGGFWRIFGGRPACRSVSSHVGRFSPRDASCGRPYLGCKIAIRGLVGSSALICTYGCNTYTAGERCRIRRARHARPESTYIRWLWCCGRLRAGFVLRPGPTSAAISPDRPPMGVVPSSNRDYGLRRGRCSPRASRTRILYLPEKSLGSPRCTRVCIHRVPRKNRLVTATGAHLYCAPSRERYDYRI